MKFMLNKDGRGIATIGIIAIVLVVIAGAGFVGYRVMNKDKETKSSSISASDAKAASEACLKQYNDKELCKFTSNYDLEKEPYIMTMTNTTGGQTSTTTMSSEGKGNTEVKSGSGDQQFAVITVDGFMYTKDPTDGKWVKTATSSTSTDTDTEKSPVSDIKFDTEAADAASKVTYKKIGKEKCGNLNCVKYQMIDSSTPATTTYVWFDTKDYRMQRFTSKDAEGSSDMTIAYKKVKITAPTPVKEAAADSGTPADAAAIQAQIQAEMNAAGQ